MDRPQASPPAAAGSEDAPPSPSWMVRLVRIAGWAAVTLWFLFAATVLTLRYAVLPRIADFRADIEAAATRAVGLPVLIGRIEAGWDGLNPELILSDVVLSDRQGRPALALSKVEAVLSWQSFVRLSPTLALFAIEGPVLNVRRDAGGRITVAGIAMEGESDPALLEWVLDQPHIRIRDALVVWEDGLRKAPPLVLEDLQFGLDNSRGRHRFGLTAVPPARLAARIDLRGEFRGAIGEALEQVSGKVYAELQYADLAGWRTWVDYPVHLPRGRGAVRLWGDWDEGRAQVTADMALEDLRIRLGDRVPELDLVTMRGRVHGKYGRGAWEAEGHAVELATLDGVRLEPTDFKVEWRQEAGSDRIAGSAAANQLDLGALQRLAGHLPLDERSRELLATHRPEGRVIDLRANWLAEGGALGRYGLKARFERLGLTAAGVLPGATGLSGTVEADEKGGSLELASREASLDLPTVFAEPRLPFDDLRGRATWKLADGKLDSRLERLDFSSPDATGTARGSYLRADDGPGVIDLTATISRAQGTAVWRYIPLAVNADTRNWLRRGIVRGTASDARLTLKGDLRDFPFRDPAKGKFLITAKAHQVTLDVAAGWPVIEKIDADMSFGVGMRIEAGTGAIFGAQLGPTTAEIPDFESTEEMLFIRGSAQGPTAEFLRFIDKSPVGERIDRFTEDMVAAGNGSLSLEFDMPLRRVDQTAVRGEFQFRNNTLTVVPGLPPVSQVNGSLKVTEKAVVAPEITGRVLGGPMRLSVRNEEDRVNVVMGGTANVKEARKIFETPLFDHVAGTTAWKGEVRVRKKTADFIIETALAGVSSSLPDPFNKNAGSTAPLRIEKSNQPDGGDQIRLSLGKVLEATLLRRVQGDELVLDKGVIAVGEPLPKMPAQGLLVAVSQPRIDADAWREALAGGNGTGAAQGGTPALPPLQVVLRTPLLHLFDRDIHDVQATLRSREDGWQASLNTREAEGEATWRSAGEGWLQADLKRLAIPAASQDGGAGEDGPPESLPGLDVRVADFSLGDKRLGRLEVKAKNERAGWNLESLTVHNPDGVLKGRGLWSRIGSQRTRLGFELVATDAGKLLGRLGHPGTLKRGTANLKGDLEWAGPLTAIDFPTLSGRLDVNAAKGQFAKLDPGLGKLLGLLSLQSLPRRLSLDFRDIFSEGFAFDAIEGKLDIRQGMMRTSEDLRIDGPAARVLMKGEADLRQETQDVVVTVQPELGSVVSVGALLLANPAIGAAAVVANKILQNPLSRIFNFQYHVTGAWADPKVEKLGHTVDEAAIAAGRREAEAEAAAAAAREAAARERAAKEGAAKEGTAREPAAREGAPKGGTP
ncbi:MAG: TIGR02099 family protein [Betaproteobacteria bacterium]|nr:TIGR02099 family protein [Betaproteobacteria bacterium]